MKTYINILKENFIRYKSLIFAIGALLIGIFIVLRVIQQNTSQKVSKTSTNLSSLPNVSAAEKPTNDSSSNILVDISGAVLKPGVYKLPTGSRIADVIAKASGFTFDACYKSLHKQINLAKILKDEDKVYIPFEWDLKLCENDSAFVLASAPNKINTGANDDDDTEGGGSAKVNINKASKSELEALPGIGEVTAQKILDLRPYKDLADLQTKTKISQTIIDKFSDLITF